MSVEVFIYSPFRRNYIMRNRRAIVYTLVRMVPNIAIEHPDHGLI